MRKIRFRGKIKYTQRWIDGYLWQGCNEAYYIKTEEKGEFGSDLKDFEVFPETVGQYWRTVNDVDLYDGDIFTIEGKYSKIVRYKEDKACFCVANLNQLECEDVFDIWQIPDEKWWNERNILIDVIGNEFDNPELLK